MLYYVVLFSHTFPQGISTHLHAYHHVSSLFIAHLACGMEYRSAHAANLTFSVVPLIGLGKRHCVQYVGGGLRAAVIVPFWKSPLPGNFIGLSPLPGA